MKNYRELEEFEKKLDFNQKLGLDHRDAIILSLIQENPGVSQEEIAGEINLSQPAVGARLKKLKEKGIMQTVHGVNFKTAELHLGKVDVNTTQPKKLIDEFEGCPFFINALHTSGRHNLCLFFMATDLKRLEGIVNHHIRGKKHVKDAVLNVIIDVANDLVLPIKMNFQNTCDQECIKC